VVRHSLLNTWHFELYLDLIIKSNTVADTDASRAARLKDVLHFKSGLFFGARRLLPDCD
jgi:hypothetical protein